MDSVACPWRDTRWERPTDCIYIFVPVYCVVFSACFRRMRQPDLLRIYWFCTIPSSPRDNSILHPHLWHVCLFFLVCVYNNPTRALSRAVLLCLWLALCDSHENTRGPGIIPASLTSPEPSHELLMLCGGLCVCFFGTAGTHRIYVLCEEMRGFSYMLRQYLCGHSCICIYMMRAWVQVGNEVK